LPEVKPKYEHPRLYLKIEHTRLGVGERYQLYEEPGEKEFRESLF